MNIEEYRDYSLSKKGVSESTPFFNLRDALVFEGDTIPDKTLYTVIDISYKLVKSNLPKKVRLDLKQKNRD